MSLVTVKEATQNAIRFAVDVLGESRTGNIRLEEVESVTIGDREFWLITLSMIHNEGINGPFEAIRALTSEAKREYKSFHVSKDTGEVSAMKIREFATM